MRLRLFYVIMLSVIFLMPIDVLTKQVYKGHQKEFDYIIVGFGSAGAILARKLSDDFKTSVLVLEAGPNNMQDPATLDANVLANFANFLKVTYNPAFAATYPVPLAGSLSALTYSEGREWGGSAAHNYLQAVRPVPDDTRGWVANSRNLQWSYPNILPLMRALETYTPNGTVANPTQRGFSGPIFITQNVPVDGNVLASATASVAGAPLISDYNDATLSNVSTFAVQQFITPGMNSRRSYSAYEFMTIGQQMDEKGRGLNGRKCRVLGNTVVMRIMIQEGRNGSLRAEGVEYIRNKARGGESVAKAYARKKVILCAGSINSPKILMLSGVGDATMLNDLGIEVKVDNPNVGANLQNHYGPLAIVTNSSGPIPGGQFGSFIDERPYMPADSLRRLQITAIDTGAVVQMIGFVLHPSSKGLVSIVSKDPLIPAKVDFNMYSDGAFSVVGSDAYLAVSYYKIIQAIAAAAGESVVFPRPDQYAQGDAALFQAASSIEGTIIADHIAGTTRMSSSIETGVVDGNLQVHGVDNLMVADVSVEDPITSGNTCYGAYVIALIAAQVLGVPTPPAL